LQNSLSEGIVSGIREIRPGVSWLQTTASISPGSSGGPLLLPNGAVVGVSSAQLRGEGVQNLNFAVAAPTIWQFLDRPFGHQ
jgi:S1-C subfamily serine protease